MGKHHKKFDVHCDYCGEVVDMSNGYGTGYNTFNEWQEHEANTISLDVCIKCQIEEWKKYRLKYREENIIVESVDKRSGLWYNIINKLKGRR